MRRGRNRPPHCDLDGLTIEPLYRTRQRLDDVRLNTLHDVVEPGKAK
jgi:hypothetical protein